MPTTPAHSIFIFNPETDLALALGRKPYTPPLPVKIIRKERALTPLPLAQNGDCLIALDDYDESSRNKHEEICQSSGVQFLTLSDAAAWFRKINPREWMLKPWGWNHSLRSILLAAGAPETLLKSNEYIDRLRMLSHRRTVIPFQDKLRNHIPTLWMPEVKECSSTEEALNFAHRHPAMFKAPWSSSGRGVVLSSSLSEARLAEWVDGCIRHQRSVMAETALDKMRDFASEWICDNGKARFLGLSMFSTSPEGRYLGNHIMPQDTMRRKLEEESPAWSETVLEAQEEALNQLISPFYDGPVGIDMLLTSDGFLHPCVEINLRHTMGMVALCNKPHLQRFDQFL